MSKSPQDVLSQIKDEGIELIDLKFTDIHGKWQHLTLTSDMIEEDSFTEGLAFDGSSIRGWKAINASDMSMVPDASTAWIDPFYKHKTLSMICSIQEPRSGEPYDRCPRALAQKALKYLDSTGIADTAFFGPEPEFFLFDDVRYDSKEGEKILIAKKGYFGDRLVDMATRYKADVSVIEKPWGESFSYEEIKYEIETKKPAIFAIVHAETSSGVLQPLDGIGDVCRKNNCLFLVDAVTSLGALELLIDEWKIDLAYSCSQKGLSCPPGLSPFTMNNRAEEKLSSRKTKVPNWYLDLSLLNKYWGSDRVYHHTAPVNMNFAIREGLRLIANEGLENVWNRHNTNAKKLWNGLESLGMELHVSEDYRLPTLTTVKIPPAVDGDGFRNHLLRNFGIEIGNGLGELSGKVWRIGLMGFNSSEENVDRLLNLFDTELKKYSIFESSTF